MNKRPSACGALYTPNANSALPAPLPQVAIPVVINIGQAWIQDQVLKWKHRKPSPGVKAAKEDKEPIAVTARQEEVGGALSVLQGGTVAGNVSPHGQRKAQ